MKVVFICGSLEMGKDGVGDYARRLAGQLRKWGHLSYLIAYNDKHISTSGEAGQEAEGETIPALRISHLETDLRKFFLANEKISVFDPDWLSLQFVPFSFQKKGLPWKLGHQLARLGKGRRWHIMFHELWVGMDREAPIKHKVLGKLQKYIVKKELALLAPTLINTQSSVYLLQLQKMGQKARLLPLFGNIPVSQKKSEKKDVGKLSFLVFGMIQPKAPFASFSAELAKYRRDKGIKIHFVFIGRNGMELEKWVEICERNEFEVEVLGEQSMERISQEILKSQWGITSTPYLQSEKSGTVAAMREHRLPIYCVARSWNPNVSVPQLLNGIREYKENKLELQFPPFLSERGNQLERVARLFSRNLMVKMNT